MRVKFQLTERRKEQLGYLAVAAMLVAAVILTGCDIPGYESERASERTASSPPLGTAPLNPGPSTTGPAPTVPVLTTPVMFDAAEEAYHNRRFAEAVELFTRYLERKPESPWGHYMLGLSAWKNGQHDRAEAAFHDALARDPSHVKSLLNLSRVLLETGRAAEALESVELAVELDSAMVDALRVKGRALSELGRVDDAIETYRQTLLLNDQDVWTMNNLGLIYLEHGQLDLALPPLARAAELAPEIAVFHNNLGMALELSGYFGDAVAAYRAALEVDESHAKAAANVARLEGRPDASMIDLDLGLLARAFEYELARWRAPTGTPPAPVPGREILGDSIPPE